MDNDNNNITILLLAKRHRGDYKRFRSQTTTLSTASLQQITIITATTAVT